VCEFACVWWREAPPHGMACWAVCSRHQPAVALQDDTMTPWAKRCHARCSPFATPGSVLRSCCRATPACPWCALRQQQLRQATHRPHHLQPTAGAKVCLGVMLSCACQRSLHHDQLTGSVCCVTGGKAAAPVASRELEGKLYAGHESFEWLLAVISHVMCAEVRAWWVLLVCVRLQQPPSACRFHCPDHAHPHAACACPTRHVPAEAHAAGVLPVGADSPQGQGGRRHALRCRPLPRQAVPAGARGEEGRCCAGPAAGRMVRAPAAACSADTRCARASFAAAGHLAQRGGGRQDPRGPVW
jgi:hypothetical protein